MELAMQDKAEAIALHRWKKGMGDKSVAMLSSLVTAALSRIFSTFYSLISSLPRTTTGQLRDLLMVIAAIEPPPYETRHARTSQNWPRQELFISLDMYKKFTYGILQSSWVLGIWERRDSNIDNGKQFIHAVHCCMKPC